MQIIFELVENNGDVVPVHSYSLYYRQGCNVMGCARTTVCEWWNLFGEVCSIALTHETLLVGTAFDPIQIDYSYFQGKRKYHRGRLFLIRKLVMDMLTVVAIMVPELKDPGLKGYVKVRVR